MKNLFSTKFNAAAIALMSGILSTSVVFAESAHEHHSSSIADLIPYWVNFLIYSALVYFAVRGVVKASWNTRKEKLSASINAGRIEREKAQKNFEEASRRLESLGADKEALIVQIKRETETEIEDVFKESRERAHRVLAQAEEMVEGERKALATRLRQSLGGEVIQRAKTILASEVSGEVDKALRNSALKGIEKLVIQ